MRATNICEGLESESLPLQVQNKSIWVDCTAFMDNVCSNMEVGEMLHHPTKFSLLEVMSVIEMMDPKMDSSYNTPRVKSVSERFMDGSLPPFESLSLRQIIYTMDCLFSAEMHWYDGFTLPQTVFSCLYLHDDLRYIQANKTSPKTSIFLLFTKTLFRRLDEVIELMFKTECRTDEEFVNNSFGMLNMKGLDTPSELFTNLARLESDLSDRMKGKSKTFEPLQNDPDKEVAYVEALLSRIRFQRLFYRVHHYLSDPLKADLPQALKAASAAIEELKIIQRQHAELFSIEEENLSIAFDPKITIRVSSASVLKPIDLPSFMDSVRNIEQYLQHLSFICTAKKQCQNLTQILKFFTEFSQIPNVNVVARSRLMYIAVVEGKVFGTNMRDIVLKHVLNELPMLNEHHRKLFRDVTTGDINKDLNHNVQIDDDLTTKRDCDEWLNMMANCFLSVMNSLCSNASTHRRKLAHLIADWGLCEQRAEILDLSCIDGLREKKRRGEEGFNVEGKEHLFALTYFCIELTAECIYQYLIMGFDLQLYHRTELHHVYWYIDYISGLRIQNTNKILQRLVVEGISEKKPKKSKKKEQIVSEPKTRIVPVEPSTDQRVLRVLLEADSLMSRALCRFLHALLICYNENGIENVFDDKTLPNVIPELRFERRFQPFYSVAQPPPVRYDSYSSHLRNVLRDVTPAGLIGAAADHFNAAKRLADNSLLHMASILSDSQVEKLKAIGKVAQANQISVMVANMRVQQSLLGTNITPLPLPIIDFTYSSQYPVIKLPSSTITDKK